MKRKPGHIERLHIPIVIQILIRNAFTDIRGHSNRMHEKIYLAEFFLNSLEAGIDLRHIRRIAGNKRRIAAHFCKLLRLADAKSKSNVADGKLCAFAICSRRNMPADARFIQRTEYYALLPLQ